MAKTRGRDDVLSSFLDILLFRKWLVLIGILSVVATTVIGIYFMPPVFKASTIILVNPPTVPKGDIPFLTDMRNPASFLSSQPALIKSQAIYEKAARDLGLYQAVRPASLWKKAKRLFLKIDADPAEEALDILYGSTSVNQMRGTNLIQISASATTSWQAADMANALAKTYINYINTSLSGKAQDAYRYLETEAQSSRDKLAAAQANLQEFKARENVLSLPSMEGVILETARKLDQYREQYARVQWEITRLSGAGDPDETAAPGQDDVIEDIRPDDSPNVIVAKKNLMAAKAELTSMLVTFTESHPDVPRLREHITVLRQELARESRTTNARPIAGGSNSELDNLQAAAAELSKRIAETRNIIAARTRQTSEMARLTQEANSREQEYLQVRQQLESARSLKSSEQENEESIRVVNPAVPPTYPDNKKKMVLLLVGVMVSFVFGCGMAFVAEYFDHTFRDADDVEKSLKLPVFGAIPPITTKMRQQSERASKSGAK